MKATATTQDNMDQSSCSGGGKNQFPNIVEDEAKQERSSGCVCGGEGRQIAKTKTKHQKKSADTQTASKRNKEEKMVK